MSFNDGLTGTCYIMHLRNIHKSQLKVLGNPGEWPCTPGKPWIFTPNELLMDVHPRKLIGFLMPAVKREVSENVGEIWEITAP